MLQYHAGGAGQLVEELVESGYTVPDKDPGLYDDLPAVKDFLFIFVDWAPRPLDPSNPIRAVIALILLSPENTPFEPAPKCVF